MKAFVVTIIAPNEWQQQDIAIAINLGMQEVIRREGQRFENSRNALTWSAQVETELALKRQDI